MSVPSASGLPSGKAFPSGISGGTLQGSRRLDPAEREGEEKNDAKDFLCRLFRDGVRSAGSGRHLRKSGCRNPERKTTSLFAKIQFVLCLYLCHREECYVQKSITVDYFRLQSYYIFSHVTVLRKNPYMPSLQGRKSSSLTYERQYLSWTPVVGLQGRVSDATTCLSCPEMSALRKVLHDK